MQGEQAAIMRLPPAAAANTDAINKAAKTAFSAVAVLVAIPQAGAGCWITLKPEDQNCRIAFGTSSVVATANDEIFFSGSSEDYWCPSGTTHFSVIRSTADGTLSWHRSST